MAKPIEECGMVVPHRADKTDWQEIIGETDQPSLHLGGLLEGVNLALGNQRYRARRQVDGLAVDSVAGVAGLDNNHLLEGVTMRRRRDGGTKGFAHKSAEEEPRKWLLRLAIPGASCKPDE